MQKYLLTNPITGKVVAKHSTFLINDMVSNFFGNIDIQKKKSLKLKTTNKYTLHNITDEEFFKKYYYKK
jgi:hypothetical protein